MKRPEDRERGVATIEMALVVGLLLMIALGAFEYGMAFRSWFGVTAASREGARVAASAGSATQADCTILEASAAALLSNNGNEVVALEIFRHDPDTGINGPTSRFRPKTDDDEDNLICGNWVWESLNYPPASRDDQGSTRDWVGVRVTYRHFWITGAFWWSGDVTWTNETVMHIEPVPYTS